MITIGLMENTIQAYAWGSRTAIAEIMGNAQPSPEPQAELWMGAHPKAPSRVQIAGTWHRLNDLAAANPDAVLGPVVRDRLGNAFPFLLKILAAEQPLSIQAHPDAQQARQGYARENRADIDLAASHRNYRDPNPKPECIVALTSFWALNGFRPVSDTIRYLTAVAKKQLADEIQILRKQSNADGITTFFSKIMKKSSDEKRFIVDNTIQLARENGETDPVYRWMLRLYNYYPEDIGVLSPAFLNLICLQPGQAMFLDAGRLHAYLEGTGIEIMGNSDNVLRGGLTPKHIDVPELIQVLHFEPESPKILSEVRVSPQESLYASPVDLFRLSRITSRGERFTLHRLPGDGPEILLCTEGNMEVFEEISETRLTVTSGQSVFVTNISDALHLSGIGTLFRAGVNLSSSR